MTCGCMIPRLWKTQKRLWVKTIPEIVWCTSLADAVRNADAIVLATEWGEFSTLDFVRLKAEMAQPILFDLRNIYHKEEVTAFGFEHYGTGV